MDPDRTTTPQRSALLVEDEPMLLMVIAETMRDAGYQVWEATDGFSAINILEAQPHIDILITDIKMPGMNGYQLAEKAMAAWPDLRVMLMTGYAQDPIPKEMAEAGVKVLLKPFDLDRLPEAAKSLLSDRPA